MIYSIDPGEGCCWAEWDAGKLKRCGPWNDRVVVFFREDTAVIEDQVIYPRRGRFRGTPNPASIIKLAQYAGAVAVSFGWPLDPTRVTWVKPRSWKRSTAKPKAAKNWASYTIHRLVVRALDQDELDIYHHALVELPAGGRYDLIDAVGIGLWHLGRLSMRS